MIFDQVKRACPVREHSDEAPRHQPGHKPVDTALGVQADPGPDFIVAGRTAILGNVGRDEFEAVPLPRRQPSARRVGTPAIGATDFIRGMAICTLLWALLVMGCLV